MELPIDVDLIPDVVSDLFPDFVNTITLCLDTVTEKSKVAPPRAPPAVELPIDLELLPDIVSEILL